MATQHWTNPALLYPVANGNAALNQSSFTLPGCQWQRSTEPIMLYFTRLPMATQHWTNRAGSILNAIGNATQNQSHILHFVANGNVAENQSDFTLLCSQWQHSTEPIMLYFTLQRNKEPIFLLYLISPCNFYYKLQISYILEKFNHSQNINFRCYSILLIKENTL